MMDTINNVFKFPVLMFIGSGWANFFISIVAFCPALMYVSAKINDELLDQIFNWRELLCGYVLFGVLFSGYYAVLALPFVSISYVLGGNLFLQLAALIEHVFTGVVVNLIFFSFLIKVRNMTVLITMGIILFFLRTSPLLFLGVVEGIICLLRIVSPLRNTFSLELYSIVVLLLLGIVAIRLCRSHFLQPKRTTTMIIGINIVAYGVLTIIVSVLWLLLRLSGLI
jgi:hypothetical protein